MDQNTDPRMSRESSVDRSEAPPYQAIDPRLVLRSNAPSQTIDPRMMLLSNVPRVYPWNDLQINENEWEDFRRTYGPDAMNNLTDTGKCPTPPVFLFDDADPPLSGTLGNLDQYPRIDPESVGNVRYIRSESPSDHIVNYPADGPWNSHTTQGGKC